MEASKATPRSPARRAPAQSASFYHESVLTEEVVRLLAPLRGKLLLDGTLGGGGHSGALLAAGARVIALDQDPEALVFAEKRLADFGENFQAVRASFAKTGDVLDALGIGEIGGALLDLGVSSRQLETPARGFSFMHDGPLDMRMDPQSPVSAADLVNTLSGDQLERVFRNFGEEPAARRVAARLVRERMLKPFTTTLQLAGAVEAVIPRRSKTHPATHIFQALRIAVNRELDVLAEGLEAISRRLAPGARFAVISFHSLESRIVKNFFRQRATEFLDQPEWPEPRPNPEFIFKEITRKPVVASESEQRANPRSRSAELRMVERISNAR